MNKKNVNTSTEVVFKNEHTNDPMLKFNITTSNFYWENIPI